MSKVVVARGTVRFFDDVVVEANSTYTEFVARLCGWGATLYEGESLPEAVRVATEATPFKTLQQNGPPEDSIRWILFAAEFRAAGHNIAELNDDAHEAIVDAEAMYSPEPD